MSGYARIDLRLDEAGNVWVLEANPNPQIAKGEDFAASAEKVGISYEGVLQRIINLGIRWQPESVRVVEESRARRSLCSPGR